MLQKDITFTITWYTYTGGGEIVIFISVRISIKEIQKFSKMSKPLLKTARNAGINHAFGAQFVTLKTWALCQFNPKFPRKHIFQIITQSRHLYRTSTCTFISRARKSRSGLTARVSISPGKKFADDKYDCFSDSPATRKKETDLV